MWRFVRKQGQDGDVLRDDVFIGHAYSGYDDGDGIPELGEGKNDPTKERLRGIGPVPRGRYRMSRPFFHETAGPYVIRLTPLEGTETYGRSGFLVHGDSVRLPGSVSHGCIVAHRAIRVLMGEAVEEGDDILEVV